MSPEQAKEHCIAGVSVWKQFSTDEGKNPDVVLVGCGVETTTEVINAAALLKKKAPNLRVRVVNIVGMFKLDAMLKLYLTFCEDLLVLSEPGSHPHALDKTSFDSIFTKDAPVIINFHGYPSGTS